MAKNKLAKILVPLSMLVAIGGVWLWENRGTENFSNENSLSRQANEQLSAEQISATAAANSAFPYFKNRPISPLKAA